MLLFDLTRLYLNKSRIAFNAEIEKKKIKSIFKVLYHIVQSGGGVLGLNKYFSLLKLELQGEKTVSGEKWRIFFYQEVSP